MLSSSPERSPDWPAMITFRRWLSRKFYLWSCFIMRIGTKSNSPRPMVTASASAATATSPDHGLNAGNSTAHAHNVIPMINLLPLGPAPVTGSRRGALPDGGELVGLPWRRIFAHARDDTLHEPHGDWRAGRAGLARRHGRVGRCQVSPGVAERVGAHVVGFDAWRGQVGLPCLRTDQLCHRLIAGSYRPI